MKGNTFLVLGISILCLIGCQAPENQAQSLAPVLIRANDGTLYAPDCIKPDFSNKADCVFSEALVKQNAARQAEGRGFHHHNWVGFDWEPYFNYYQTYGRIFYYVPSFYEQSSFCGRWGWSHGCGQNFGYFGNGFGNGGFFNSGSSCSSCLGQPFNSYCQTYCPGVGYANPMGNGGTNACQGTYYGFCSDGSTVSFTLSSETGACVLSPSTGNVPQTTLTMAGNSETGSFSGGSVTVYGSNGFFGNGNHFYLNNNGVACSH